MSTITIHDKLACIQRELSIRKQVYPQRVASKKMGQQQADREIAVMESILNDYEKSAKFVEPETTVGDD